MQLFQTDKPNSLLEPQSRKLAACLLSAFNAAKPDALQKSLMKDFGLIIQTILKKLMEKCCPLNYDLVRNASYLTPDNISLKKRQLSRSLVNWSQKYMRTSILNAEEADKTKDPI